MSIFSFIQVTGPNGDGGLLIPASVEEVRRVAETMWPGFVMVPGNKGYVMVPATVQ